ncbi:MAG: hypothetical protein J5716_06345, partial [Alphaproteobacteria bacterium]|nr:hypothetical protein [Alphaproteobacteria bacterium]
QDRRLIPLDESARFLSYHADFQMIYGVWNKDGKDLISRMKIDSASDFSFLFALSNKTISHTAVSPDNQKIAFLATDKTTQETQLRVIIHEEFGWFPLPFIKIPASFSPVCFCSSDVLMYTDVSGALKAVRLYKQLRTVEISPQGHSPVYSGITGFRAFIQNKKIVVSGKTQDEIETNNVSALSFSKSGEELLFADANTLCRYNLMTKEKADIFRAEFPIVFIAEL